jgi:hypothetical protein
MSQFRDQGSANPRGRKRVAWRRDPVILARLPNIERLHLAGRSNVAIGIELDMPEATVRDDLGRLRDLWLERTATAQDENRARALAELEDVRVRALEAAEWDQMCERAVLFDDLPEPEATTLDGKPARRSVYRDAKGSAQFRGKKAAALAQARQAVMDKAKLLGLVVDKAALTDSQGDDLPLDELMERFARRQQAETTP